MDGKRHIRINKPITVCPVPKEIFHVPHFYSRYRMKPGITGLAQVSGLRGNTETEQHLIDRFGRDLQYAAEWTPILDIAIMLRTVTHLLKGTNAF